jgi:hypothetical protein
MPDTSRFASCSFRRSRKILSFGWIVIPPPESMHAVCT